LTQIPFSYIVTSPLLYGWRGKTEELMLIDQIIEQKQGALRASDIARILDLSAKQIYKMAASGEIPSLRIANSVRFDPHDFAVWLRTRSSAPDIEPNASVSAHRSRSHAYHRRKQSRQI
jgi:predicted DNA-binding transcriptional regulator AlpA